MSAPASNLSAWLTQARSPSAAAGTGASADPDQPPPERLQPDAGSPPAASAPAISGRGIPAGLANRTGTGAVLEMADESGEKAGENSDRITSDVEALLQRVNRIVGPVRTSFEPVQPSSLAATGLTTEEIEKLVLKFLHARGSATGRQIAGQVRLPFGLIENLLKTLRHDMLVSLKGTAEAGDYEFAITESGRSRAANYARECAYFGSAPVCLRDYLDAMAAQSIAKAEVSEESLRQAFSDLIISPELLERLGPAINSGRGMFLFGDAGNGKTSIAERITRAFGSTIWIPRALGIDGEIIHLFDPGVHKVVEEPRTDSLIDNSEIDGRWVRIERPTVVVGGELTMDDLEVTLNPSSRICEAPVQLKSNCGVLVIDDFGRQRMPVAELLNRWIVPLEKRYDFLNLPSGRKLQMPFDQLIVFSTNLEPKNLVDGAFLRRIPYKIQVPDPTPEQFHAIFERLAPALGFEYEAPVVEYLIQTHFLAVGRPFRSCHPRDLLLQVRNQCTYQGRPKKMTPAGFDFAVQNYFSVM